MRTLIVAAAAAVVGLAGTAATARPPAAADAPHVGTWKLVEGKYRGKAFSLEKEGVNLKHVTPTHAVSFAYHPGGEMVRGAGGAYTVRGEELTETAEFALGRSADDGSLGRSHTSRLKVAGDKLYVSWDAVEHVWERVAGPKGGPPVGPPVGTWKFVSFKSRGGERAAAADAPELLVVTPAHTLRLAVGRDGKVAGAVGGPHAAKGDEVTVAHEYDYGPVYSHLKGARLTRTFRVVGDRLALTFPPAGGVDAVETWEPAVPAARSEK